jgi:hypothetical protein
MLRSGEATCTADQRFGRGQAHRPPGHAQRKNAGHVNADETEGTRDAYLGAMRRRPRRSLHDLTFPRLSSTSGTWPLDPLRRIGASRVSLPPHLRTPKSRTRRRPPGAVLDTARASRAPSRSSGSRVPFVLLPPLKFEDIEWTGAGMDETVQKPLHVDYPQGDSSNHPGQSLLTQASQLGQACPAVSKSECHHATDREEQVTRLSRVVGGEALVIDEVESVEVTVGHRPDLR